MKNLKFYKCKHCGNIIIKVVDCGVPVFCCGEIMEEIKVNTTEGAVEKHKPVLKIDGNKIKVVVGEISHPMTTEHYISFIALQTNKGYYIKNLTPENTPEVTFVIEEDEQIINSYAYCNLHGLWNNQ